MNPANASTNQNRVADPRVAEALSTTLAGQPEAARLAAVQLLHEAEPESVHEVLRLAQASARVHAFRRRVYYLGCAGSAFSMAGIIVAASFDREGAAVLLQAASSSFLVVAAAGAPPEDRALSALLRLNDPRAVGPIAMALDKPDTRWIAEEVLIRLLPRMRASDAGHLTKEQRVSLYRNLRRNNTRFVLACLEALKQVGDESALPQVRALAERRRPGSAAREIREAAREALPYLEMRLSRERQRRTLLRAAPEPTERLPIPSAEPADRFPRPAPPPGGYLLRPVRDSRINSDTLVRPDARDR